MSPEKRPLGDLLVEAGIIGPGELAQALEVQQASGQRLGEVLVALGFVTEADVAKALAGQLGVSFVPDHELRVNMAVARLLPPQLCRRTMGLPLKEEHGFLVVAMADPLDVVALDEIRHLTRRAIKPVAATRAGLSRAIAQYERLAALGRRDAANPEVAVAQPQVLLAAQPDDAPVVQLVNELVDRAIAEGASDIHVEPAEGSFRVRFRIDGFLREIVTPPMTYHAAVVARIKVLAELDISERRIPQDGRLELRGKGRNVDLRVSTLPTVHGEKVVMRLFNRDKALPKLEEIGFRPEIFKEYTEVIRKPYGMLLVTGPTGSGKTTTLMSSLAYVNDPEKNIVTIEDPVEYQLAGINHVQVHSKAGLTFADGLRSILRQDPNIIMIGEIRDGETADVAVRAALTGHLVLSTLHTNDAPGALTRLVDMGVEPYLISSSVLGVLAQRLVRRLCPACKEAYEAESDTFAAYGCSVEAGKRIPLYRAKGCPRCRGTGYAGRYPIFEFLRMNQAVQELVLQQASTAEIRNQAYRDGMRLLVTNGLETALAGQTTPEEVFRVASFGEA
ncbi:MAG: GspE/PulE family protein [Bacillota bacterium]